MCDIVWLEMHHVVNLSGMYYLILYLATWDKDRRTTGAPPLEWGQWNSISYLDSMHSDYFLAHPKVQKKGDDLVLIIGWYWLYGQFFMGIMILSKTPSGSIARHGNPRSIHGGLVRWHFIVEVNWGFPSKACLIASPIGSMVLLYMVTFTINIPQSC